MRYAIDNNVVSRRRIVSDAAEFDVIGDYFAIAVDDMEPNMLRDPDALERLSRGATRVSLTEGAKIDVSLRRIKLSDLVADR